MDAELLSLKWNNHRSTFSHVLETIHKKGLYSDVTLACDGRYFATHKLVLSTCSDYFQEMLEKTQCKHPIIILKDVKNQDLESLLSYMYMGEVNVLQNELSSLIKAAECLRIKGLAVPDEPPPSKKSSKRLSDREEHSTNKRNCNKDLSPSTPPREQQINTSSQGSVVKDHCQVKNSCQGSSLPIQVADNENTLAEEQLEPVAVKIEKSDDDFCNVFENSNGNSQYKIHNAQASEGFMSTEDGSQTLLKQREISSLDDGASFPSTSGYEDSTNWARGFETMHDDEREVSDHNAFTDSSQVDKAPMDQTSFPSQRESSSSCELVRRDGTVWVCSLCGYGSYGRCNVLTHIRKHTGERPFKCSSCEKQFSQSGHMYRHMRKVHSVLFNQ